MIDQPATQPAITEARSHIYGLFARAFSHPDVELLDSLFSAEFIEALSDTANYLPYPSPFPGKSIRLIGAGYDRADIDVFYASAFEAGQTGISLRESSYSTKNETEVLQDTFRFYEHFGLNFSDGELRELPDTLAVQLEFMHYLSYLQAQSHEPETVSALTLAQADFLKRHLINWIPSLAKALIELAAGRLYDQLILLLQAFLLADLQFLQKSH